MVFSIWLMGLSLSAQSYYFHRLDQQSGLSNTFNAHFSVDRDGYFWTSSRDGLNRYDGHRVTVFRPEWRQEAIDPNITSKVYQAYDNKRWFTSNSALHALDPGQDSLYSWRFLSDQNSYYYAFHLERDSFLWVAAHDSLYVVPVHSRRPDTVRARHTLDGFQLYAWLDSRQRVRGIAHPLIRNGSGLEVIQYTGQDSIRRDTFLVSQPGTQVDTALFYVHIDSDGTFWMPSSVGLIRFHPDQPGDYCLFVHTSDPAKSKYQAIAPWGNRFLWLSGGQEGLLLYDKRAEKFLRQQSILHVEGRLEGPLVINNLYIDRSENLWLSIFGYGLLHTNLRQVKFSNIIPPATLQRNSFSVKAIVPLTDSSYLVAAGNQGAIRIRPDTLGQFSLERQPIPCLAGKTVNYAYPDSNGAIWLTTPERIYRWDPVALTCTAKAVVSSIPFELSENEAGQMLLLEVNQLVSYPRNTSFFRTDTLQTARRESNFLSSMLIEPVHQIGFLMYRDNVLRVFDPIYPFPTLSRHRNVGFINDVYSWPGSDTIWLASSTGLYRYHRSDQQIAKERLPDQALNRSFTALEGDGAGRLWLSSFQGIFSYRPGRKVLQHYTLTDGLLSLQHVEGVAVYDPQDYLLFGSDQGIVRFAPEELVRNERLPDIRLQNIEIGDRVIPYRPGMMLTAPYRDNHLRLQFSVIEYSAPKENQFSAILLDQQQDTLSVLTNLDVEYTNLREGQYQIHAYAANSDGVWTKEPFSLAFSISPPWYRTWWAFTLGLLIFLGLVYALYRYRVKQIARREAFKRQAAEFRQKEAEYKQLVAETETAILRLQMNPHFIFNSMKSIEACILRQEMTKANQYLAQFSRLMRMILELSEHPFTSLEEDMELLELYLKAEIMRLGKDIQYAFEVDPQLDPEDTLLPTMLLQPFVENAIWHGISPKPGPGLITIRFRQKENHLICTVTDNGVGRPAAAKKDSKHNSKALSITRKRLDILSEQEKIPTSLTIEDLQEENGTPAGTRVIIHLPLIQ